KKLGITLIYVTHDQSEAMTMSDRIAVFNNGRIEQIAAPLEIYRRPATRFVGEFVGESNMIEGRVGDATERRVETEIGEIEYGPDSAFGAGMPVFAMIRPELITLAEKLPPRNGTQLTVTRTIHFGDRVSVEGTTVGGTMLRFRASGREAAVCATGS